MRDFILILIIIFLVYKLLKRKKQANKPNTEPAADKEQPTSTSTLSTIQEYPYEKRFLLTKPEYAFYQVLKLECDNRNLLICPKVRMEDFLMVTDKQNEWKYRGYIKSRHIDFLLCNNKLHLLAGIELDDSSHNRKDRAEVDKFKDNVFKTINIPLYRIQRSSGAYQPQIQKLLDELLNE